MTGSVDVLPSGQVWLARRQVAGWGCLLPCCRAGWAGWEEWERGE